MSGQSIPGDDVDKVSLCSFRCNICDHRNSTPRGSLGRDTPSCSRCGSSVRLRAIIQVLTTELFGESLSLSQIKPLRPEIKGLGLSCWEGYAEPLAKRLDYTNTYFHTEPQLDITNISTQTEGALDFIIASDVYEHIEAPVERAFINARKLLKDSGVFIFSVPFSHPDEKDIPLLEHYPELCDYQVVKEGDEYVLLNTTQDGRQQRFEQPVFHGGPGTTLELRLFSEASVIALLAQAGFNDIVIYSGSEFEHGIHWPGGWSVPIAARIRQAGLGANELRVQRTVSTNGIPVQGNLRATFNRIWNICLSHFPL